MAESKSGSGRPDERRAPAEGVSGGNGVNGATRERPVPVPRPAVADAAAALDTGLGTETTTGLIAAALRMADDGDVVGAITLMRTHLGASSRDIRAREVMAQLLERRGDLLGAAAELARALEVQPDDVSLLCRRASILIHSQRYDLAEVDLRRAVRLDDSNPEVQLNLGILNCKRARWREAIAPLERAVELDPAHATGHYYLAEAYNQTDRLRDALVEYEAVVHLEPENWRALKGVGIVLDKMGRPAEATLAYQRAREAQRR